MVRGKISVGRPHFSRQFPGWAGPEEIDDVAIATMPLGASGRYNDLGPLVSSTINALSTSFPAVPNTVQRWIPWLSCNHGDAGLTAHMWITLRDLAGNQATIVGSPDVTKDRQVSIRRPIIVPEGWVVRANLSAATSGGAALTMRCFYVDTPIGEYISPL